MSIDGMHAAAYGETSSLGFTTGQDTSFSIDLEPWDMGTTTSALNLKVDSAMGAKGGGPAVGAERLGRNGSIPIKMTSPLHLTWSFRRRRIHGSPASRVISSSGGRGLNLVILKAINVNIEANSTIRDEPPICIHGSTHQEDLPAQITTWVMTPMEIEMTIEGLEAERRAAMRDPEKTQIAAIVRDTETGIATWIKILDTYRTTTKAGGITVSDGITAMLDHLKIVLDTAHASLDETTKDFLRDSDDAETFEDFLITGLENLDAVADDVIT